MTDAEDFDTLPPAVQAAIRSASNSNHTQVKKRARSSDPRELAKLRAQTTMSNQSRSNSSARPRKNVYVARGASYYKERMMSVAPEIFRSMEECGVQETGVQDASLVALSSSNNRAFLEPPYGDAPFKFRNDVTIMYLSGEFVLKDRFICARYVTSGCASQPRVIAHMAPGPLDGMFVERPATGPLGRNCRVLSSPRSWYAPGRVLTEVPRRPLQQDGKIVVVSACAVVRGDGALYLTSTGVGCLLEPRKMGTEGAEVVPLTKLGLGTQLLIPSLVDTMTRFFALPFAAQPYGANQARAFRVDGWMKEQNEVHSLELHTTGFSDLAALGEDNPIIEAVQILANSTAHERLRVATLSPPPVEGAKESALLLSSQVQRLMTAGDRDDPHAWQRHHESDVDNVLRISKSDQKDEKTPKRRTLSNKDSLRCRSSVARRIIEDDSSDSDTVLDRHENVSASSSDESEEDALISARRRYARSRH